MQQKRFPRGAGILMPVFSLPGGYGIGDFGEEAYRFIDFLSEAGQKYWQVLPMGPTGFGDSPYAAHSAFAGNPYLIPLKNVHPESNETRQLTEGDPTRIDYARLYRFRRPLLRSYLQANMPSKTVLESFQAAEPWLWDYALYRVIKDEENGRAWMEWKDPLLRAHDADALRRFASRHGSALREVEAEQYWFDRGWNRLHDYAAMRGISVIGDIPLYVALDSADVWSNRELFLLDEDGFPAWEAGVPPDEFSATGQLWGNPLYRWEQMEKNDFAWWRARIQKNASLYDAVRIDHFIGICHYYAIPRGSADARNGTWRKGPGNSFMQTLCACNVPMIAEDLGHVSEDVVRLKRRFGIPGMNILQFAFDGDSSNPYLPHHFRANSVVYGGTHDNETLVGYFSGAGHPLDFAATYLGTDASPVEVAERCLRSGLASSSDIAIYSLADWLGLDNRARINTPATAVGNWQWRATMDAFSGELAERMRNLSSLYSR